MEVLPDRVYSKLGAALTEQVRPEWQRGVERLGEMQLGLERIRDLVLRLRTFSRLDEGEQQVVSMRESVFGEPDRLFCYSSLINQALLNVVSNAVDAIAGTGSITLTTGAQGSEYRILVSDTGSGIAESIRDRVLDPFFTTKPIGQGTGLGLPITYSILKKHAGELELSPGPEGGTLVTMRFPLVTERTG
jgi:two-component system NtrC family sensor kinase